MGVDFLFAVELGAIGGTKVIERMAREDEANGNEHGVCYGHGRAVLTMV